MRPGWVKPCECGKAERGAYCPECRGFGDGFSAGVWERPALVRSQEAPAQSAAVDMGHALPVPPESEQWCECSPCKSARVVGNAAYCKGCDGRLRPTASSSYTHGTGH